MTALTISTWRLLCSRSWRFSRAAAAPLLLSREGDYFQRWVLIQEKCSHSTRGRGQPLVNNYEVNQNNLKTSRSKRSGTRLKVWRNLLFYHRIRISALISQQASEFTHKATWESMKFYRSKTESDGNIATNVQDQAKLFAHAAKFELDSEEAEEEVRKIIYDEFQILITPFELIWKGSSSRGWKTWHISIFRHDYRRAREHGEQVLK